MPIIKSAKKRVKTARKATIRNLRTKRHLKSAVKNVRKAVDSGKRSTEKELSEAISAIDKAVKKGVVHKNKAARQKSRLVAAFKKAGGKVTGSGGKKSSPKAKAPAKKTAPSKPAGKKPAAKAKKTPAKK